MSAQHTPGPWKRCTDEEDFVSSNYGSICEVLKLRARPESSFLLIEVPQEEFEANARLIAEAPNMLREIKYSVAVYRGILEGDDLCGEDRAVVEAQIESALQAIAEATGESA